MSQDSDPAAIPATEAAGIAAAEAVELDPADLAGFADASPSIRHMLDKIDALEAAIVSEHASHGRPIQWCESPLCQTLEDWR